MYMYDMNTTNILSEMILVQNYGWRVYEKYSVDTDPCTLCLCPMKGECVFVLPCGCMFHKDCALDSIHVGKRYKCPNCYGPYVNLT